MSRKVKVLIVDDSPTMRGLIASSLVNDPDLEIVGQAGDAHEARSAIKALNPDVVTLDVEMPKMTGLEFLEKIMRLRPTPVIMVSTLTKRGAEETIQALAMGAIDCIEKPRPGNEHSFEELPFKIKIAASARVRSLAESRSAHAVSKATDAHASYVPDGRILAIGASTGGVEALISMLAGLPANCPPTVITQHMPESFTQSFANRLNKLCAARVEQATDGARLKDGQIYIAPGGNAHLEIVGSAEPRCRLRVADRVNGHCPSVDVLFNSVAKTCQGKAVGVILTGMGKDGAAGLLAMRNAGCATFGQDEASSVVYGMPKAAMAIGAVQTQLPLERIASAVISATAAK